MKRNRISVSSAILLLLLVAFTILPFYILLVGSFKTNVSLISIPVDLRPTTDLTIKNYSNVFTKSDIWLWFKNSMILSVSVAAITAFVAVTAGYAFARIKFPAMGILFALVMATMIMPKQMLLIPNYLVAYNLHLQNTMFGVIITSVAPAFGIFLSRQFILSLPKELFDAAEIDGCGEIGKFFRVALPLSLPAVGTVSIFAFFNTFNDYIWQLIMISDKSLKTLPIGVLMFSEAHAANLGAQLAVGFVSTIPMIVIFILFQRFFIKGATVGAVKG